MSDERQAAPAAQVEGAYDVVSFSNVWTGLSFVFVLLAIYSRKWIALLPWQLQGYYVMPPFAVLVVPPLSAAGVLAGWLAVRRSPGSTIARLGLLINGVILVLGSLVVLAALVFRYWRG